MEPTKGQVTVYHAATFDSWVNFTKLAIGTSPIGCLGAQTKCISIQQNLVDYRVSENGKAGEYWIQDVPFVAQSGSNFVVNQLDNIWNFSSGSAQLGGLLHPNLLGRCAQTGGQPRYYYCQGKLTIKTTLPFEILMTTTTGVLTSGNERELRLCGAWNLGISLWKTRRWVLL